MTIDINSKEFQDELIKTEKFANKVLNQFKWKFNPDDAVVDRVIKGLTNNKLLHNKRYCPCFVPQFNKNDRICPCKEAIEKEIPKDGVCHCGIFCTEEFVNNSLNVEIEQKIDEEMIEGLSKTQIEEILAKSQLNSEELEILLKAREKGVVKFKLIDIRETFEWQMGRIKGTDFLVPTSNFYAELEKVIPYKDEPWILYCHVGSRSMYVQRILTQQADFPHIGNLTYGIAAYRGEIIR
jgi:ferredoxin-thioredoxin reductase catalytic subunit/rhodanese-related sulfurtransferase